MGAIDDLKNDKRIACKKISDILVALYKKYPEVKFELSQHETKYKGFPLCYVVDLKTIIE